MKVKTVCLFFPLICLLSLGAAAKPEHLDSVKVYLPFYGNLNDWSGWNNNGESKNNVMGTDRYGNIFRAFYVQDSSGFFRVPAKNIHVPTFTYTQWVEITEIPDTAGMTIFEGGTDSCRHSLSLLPKDQDSLWMEYRLPFGDGDTVLRMAVRMPVDSWHSLTALRSKDSVFLYFDVLFSAEFYVPGNICYTGNWVNYGAGFDSSRVLKGSIDEVRVYSENIEPSLLFDIVVGERLALEKPKETNLRLYPNPGNGHWHLEAEKNLRSLTIRDQQGRLLHQETGLNGLNKEIHLSLAAGIYFLEVELEDQTRSQLRFVVK